MAADDSAGSSQRPSQALRQGRRARRLDRARSRPARSGLGREGTAGRSLAWLRRASRRRGGLVGASGRIRRRDAPRRASPIMPTRPRCAASCRGSGRGSSATATSAGVGDRLGIATPGHAAAFRGQPGDRPGPRPAVRSRAVDGPAERSATSSTPPPSGRWRPAGGTASGPTRTTSRTSPTSMPGSTRAAPCSPPIRSSSCPTCRADAPQAAIDAAFAAVPWAALEDDQASFGRRYPGPAGPRLRPAGAAAGRAPRRRGAFRAGRRPGCVDVPAPGREAPPPARFEFEVAVDEIEHRTTPVDHVYLATELRRLGVDWVSLAPRFVGEFEKGIDYLGDRAEFAADVEIHAAIARQPGRLQAERPLGLGQVLHLRGRRRRDARSGPPQDLRDELPRRSRDDRRGRAGTDAPHLAGGSRGLHRGPGELSRLGQHRRARRRPNGASAEHWPAC